MYPISGQGWQSCAPIPGSNQPGNNQQQASAPPPPRWETRWGAIATDGIRGTLGTTSDMISQLSAENGAIQDCQAKGGTQCSLNVSYSNSCGAMFVGDHGYSVNTGATMDEAVSKTLQDCSAKDQNCHVYYSNCTQAKRTQ